MNDWMEGFVSRCVSEIPDPGYRRRLSRELTDHLLSLAEELESSGLPAREAGSRALSAMGDPRELAGLYGAQWRGIHSPRYWLPKLWRSCALAGSAYLFTCFLLSLLGLTYDARPGLPMYANPGLTALAGGALWAVPSTLVVIYLSRQVQGHPWHRSMTLFALLLVWLGEKVAVLCLSSLIYGMPVWDPVPLLARISGGADPTAPWFTVPYFLITLALCPVISRLVPSCSGRRRRIE